MKEQEEMIEKFHDDTTKQYEAEGQECLDKRVRAGATSLKQKMNEKKAIRLKKLDEQKQQNVNLRAQTMDAKVIKNYNANIKAIESTKKKVCAEYEQHYETRTGRATLRHKQHEAHSGTNSMRHIQAHTARQEAQHETHSAQHEVHIRHTQHSRKHGMRCTYLECHGALIIQFDDLESPLLQHLGTLMQDPPETPP